VHPNRVERLWRREGVKGPQTHPTRGRLWLTAGSCVRHRPPPRNPVWAYDFVAVRTQAGRPLNLLTIVEEYTRECLAIDVARRVRSDDVLHRLSERVVQPGAPEPIRSANGPEFAAKAVRGWLRRGGYRPCSLNPAAPGRMALSNV
jgi:putative transposase